MIVNTTNPLGSSVNPLIVTDAQLVTAANSALSPPQPAIAVGSTWPTVAATPSGGGSTPCTGSPKIGNLCGKDAVGAYIGIALGCAAVLALMAAALAYALRGGASSRVVVLDDMAWANNYKHIMPTNVITSPYATQYGGGASGAGMMYNGGGSGIGQYGGGAMPGVYSA